MINFQNFINKSRKLIHAEIGKTLGSHAIFAGQTVGTFLGVTPRAMRGALNGLCFTGPIRTEQGG
jgi:hypothetical protein